MAQRAVLADRVKVDGNCGGECDKAGATPALLS